MQPVAMPVRRWKGTAPGMPIGWCRRSAICWVRCGSRCGSTTFTGLRVPRCPRRNASKCYSRRFPQWRRGPKDKAETAWERARSAFEYFTPEGRWNDRAQAEAGVAAALPHLSGAAWAKTRRLLLRRESFTFLDQVPERLADLGLNPDVLSALLDLEGLRRQPWRLSAATRAWALVRTVQLTKACSDWRDEAQRVRAVLRGVWRASSLVECVNSVARMQQARHRKMTQGLLDLKRLYGNLRRFRVGRRKDQTPYGLLGLDLPELSFWEFLKLTPEELREELSAQQVTP